MYDAVVSSIRIEIYSGIARFSLW